MPVFGPSGGTGGSEFNDELRFEPNSRLVRVVVRHGSQIDSIEITHERPNGQLIDFGHHGGNGGSAVSLDLNPGTAQGNFSDREHIVLVEGTYGVENIVDSIKITTNTGQILEGGEGGGPARFLYGVVGGHEIAGFFGRFGTMLDAIGVVLRPL
jgi:hypothetical protein